MARGTGPVTPRARPRSWPSDRDPWVRALAFRTLSELLRSQQDAIARQAEVDPDPIVRAALGDTEEGAGMPERAQLVSQVERMMVLRRVSIFAALDPEDLQRVASLAVEQSWAADDILMEEGALGDELIVIVEGAVRVVRGQGAEARVLRRYGEGDHIGELAVLRAAPRAATVIAERGRGPRPGDQRGRGPGPAHGATGGRHGHAGVPRRAHQPAGLR